MAENTEEQTIILRVVGNICLGNLTIMGKGVFSNGN